MTSSPARPWIKRLIPAPVRQQSRLIALSAVTIVLVVAFLGSVRMRPTVFTRGVSEVTTFAEDLPGKVDFFDRSTVHTVTIDVSDVEYAKLVTDFETKGEKTWIEADAVVDGTIVGSVGIRLKGNSTLMSLRKTGAGGAGGRGRMPQMPSGAPGMPEGFPEGFVPPEGLAPPDGAGSPGKAAEGAEAPRAPMSMSTVSFEDPSSLPLVLSFDRFIEDRGYQGMGELAVRPIVGKGATLNEALALQLLADSGQASQRYTWVTFRFRGGKETTRLVVENPDRAYAERLGWGEGALFKSRSTNEFTYKGEEPTAYADDFSQLSAKGSLDIAPVIRMLQFVESASDEEFDARLPEFIHVERFAEYVATHDLMQNFDDMSGPGRNFLLWYDAGDERFTVVTWDMNLALGGMGGMGGMGSMSRGPMGGGAAGSAPVGDPTKANILGMPGGGSRPGGAGPGGAPGGAGGGRMKMGNRLKERFIASNGFAAIREEARRRLLDTWFTSGLAARRTDELMQWVPTSEALSAETIEAERAALHETVVKAATAASTEPVPAP